MAIRQMTLLVPCDAVEKATRAGIWTGRPITFAMPARRRGHRPGDPFVLRRPTIRSGRRAEVHRRLGRPASDYKNETKT